MASDRTLTSHLARTPRRCGRKVRRLSQQTTELKFGRKNDGMRAGRRHDEKEARAIRLLPSLHEWKAGEVTKMTSKGHGYIYLLGGKIKSPWHSDSLNSNFKNSFFLHLSSLPPNFQYSLPCSSFANAIPHSTTTSNGRPTYLVPVHGTNEWMESMNEYLSHLTLLSREWAITQREWLQLIRTFWCLLNLQLRVIM